MEKDKKFDLNAIVSGIKSLINPEGGTPDVDPDDAIGIKLAEISTIIQQLGKVQLQQAKDFTKVNDLLNGLYADIEKLRSEYSSKKSTDSKS